MLILLATLTLGGCSLQNYNAEARVTAIAAGGGQGEFYVTSDLYCGPLMWPRMHRERWAHVTSEVTHCETHDGKKGRPVVDCDNLADTQSLGWAITDLDSFTMKGSRVTCEYWVLFGPGGEDYGWTPTGSPEKESGR
jgi:hypothetical protein